MSIDSSPVDYWPHFLSLIGPVKIDLSSGLSTVSTFGDDGYSKFNNSTPDRNGDGLGSIVGA